MKSPYWTYPEQSKSTPAISLRLVFYTLVGLGVLIAVVAIITCVKVF